MISLIREVVVVGVDTSAQLGSCDQALPAELVVSVVRDVELVEAGVRLREACLAHVGHQAHLVLPTDLRQILRQAIPAPDELEVDGPLLVREALEDTPEAVHYLVICVTVRVDRD